MTAKNSGKSWSKTDLSTLQKLATQNTPTRVIGIKLGRSEQAIRSKAHDEGVSLKPVNQRPYGTKK